MEDETTKKPEGSAVMRLIELGLKEGLLVKGEKYPAENLEVLLGCVKAGFADYSGSMNLEEFCKILLEGSYTFTVEYPDAFEDCARAYLVGGGKREQSVKAQSDIDRRGHRRR